MSQLNPETSGPIAIGTDMNQQMASNMSVNSMSMYNPSIPHPPLLQVPTTNRMRVLWGASIGLIIAGILIVYWYNWAIGTFKWSPERLGSLMLNKFITTPNLPELNKDHYYNYYNVKLATDKSHAICDIQKKDKISQNVLLTIPVTYIIVTVPDVSVDQPVVCGSINFNCIFV
jgi:hypothetical protein